MCTVFQHAREDMSYELGIAEAMHGDAVKGCCKVCPIAVQLLFARALDLQNQITPQDIPGSV